MHGAWILPFLILYPAAAPQAQAPAPAKAPAPIDWSAEDSSRVAVLRAQGREYAKGPVIVSAPRDSVDEDWLEALTDTLATGVDGLKRLIGGPYPWQRLGSNPIRYYLSPGRFVSHADGGGGVFISLSRARDRTAPFLHEAGHELLAPPSPFLPWEYLDSVAVERAAAEFPYWLSEGLPEYLAQSIAGATGFPEGDVFKIGGLAKADSTCAARLGGSSRWAEILEKVGGTGRLEALFTEERAEVAPVFYACSQAFTAYVVGKAGLPAVIALFPRIPGGEWRADLETAAEVPLEGLRGAWVNTLRLK